MGTCEFEPDLVLCLHTDSPLPVLDKEEEIEITCYRKHKHSCTNDGNPTTLWVTGKIIEGVLFTRGITECGWKELVKQLRVEKEEINFLKPILIALWDWLKQDEHKEAVK